MKSVLSAGLFVAVIAAPLWAQESNSQSSRQQATLHITSRAVLVDVMVTDHSGRPVTELSKDVFAVTEQGKPQTISFFEEHGNAPSASSVEMPKLPPNVFSNFSPFPQPPAVNVILLDSLNTRMESQSFVQTQAMKFLRSAKPGTRAAIFTMGLSLHFIQGFNDDPAVLAAALGNKKNLSVENPVMLKSQAESNAQERVVAMGAAGLGHLFAEMDAANEDHRKLITLGNLQRLAVFLQAFPGRKNIIWFAEKPPGVFSPGGSTGDPAVDDEIRKTIAMLGEARAALYPVDARGADPYMQYTAENNPVTISTDGGALRGEDMVRNTDQANAQILADDSGGRTFANTNGLADVLEKVTRDSSHFYTLSYVPANGKMDGAWRKIEVKVSSGRYNVSHRRGYFAVDTERPGAGMVRQSQTAQKPAGAVHGAEDPLTPFMELGMPQTQQILIEAKISPVPLGAAQPGDPKSPATRYAVDFALDAKDLELPIGKDGLHSGKLEIALLAFDRYGNVVSRKDHLVEMHIKPNMWKVYQDSGLQLHAEIAVPKGNYWLRTGIFDQQSRRVGTMEVPLAAVPPVQAAAQTHAAR
jgi:VWFA-related protein